MKDIDMNTDTPITLPATPPLFRLNHHDLNELASWFCGPDEQHEHEELKKRRAAFAKFNTLYEAWLKENPWATAKAQNLDNSIPLDINVWESFARCRRPRIKRI